MSILSEAIINVRKAMLEDPVISQHCDEAHVVPIYFKERTPASGGGSADVGDYIVLAHEGCVFDYDKFGAFNERYHMLVNAVSTDHDSALELAERIRAVLLKLQNTSDRYIEITDLRGEPAEFNDRLRYVYIIRYDYGVITTI